MARTELSIWAGFMKSCSLTALRWLKLRKALCSHILLLSIAPFALAQSTGTISGYVRDSSGAAVAGASVTALMIEQQTTHTEPTNEQGFYNFVALPAGHYKLTFEAKGFDLSVQPEVELTVSQNLRADAQLTVGAVETVIQVTTSVGLVDTTSNTLSGLVDDQRVVDLPLNGRNIMSLAAILPGVTNVSAPQTMSSARGGATMNVSGGLPSSTQYSYDGAYFNNPSRNTGLNYPPPDAIAQFRMLTTNFEAAYGHEAGAQVEVVGRAGTNSFHGSVWEFLRNSDLNAKDYFAKSVPFEAQNQFGGAAGGRIFRDKLFYFGSYQGLTNHQQVVPVQAFVPSAAERGGDFSALNTVLTDPENQLTGLPMTDGNGNPCVVGNTITAGCISPVATTILSTYVPNSATGTVVTLASAPVIDNLGNMRVDWNQSSKNLIYAHYYQEDTSFSAPFGNGDLPGYGGEFTTVTTQSVTVNDIFTFTPSLINQAIVAVLNTKSNETEPTITNASLGINMPQYAQPGVGISVASEFSLGSGGPSLFSGVNYQIGDNLTWTKGKHNFKFGFQVLKLHFNQAFIAPPQFNFTGQGTGNAVADFMLGYFGSSVTDFGLRIDNDKTAYNSFYAQDQFRLTPRFTLTYGLRYEPFLQWKSVNHQLDSFVVGAQSTVDPTAPPGVVFPGDKGVYQGIAPANLNNWAPRVGFAWDVFGDGKTSVRGGFGVFFESINANEVAQENPPYSGTTDANLGNIASPFTSTGQAAPPLTVGGKFGCTQSGTYPFYACSLFPLPVAGMLGISPTLRLPWYDEYNLSIQRQITPNLMIEAAYVGNIGTDIHGRVYNNPAVFETDPLTQAAPSAGNVDDRVEHEPGIMGSTNVTMMNYAHSTYNSLQIQATDKIGHDSSVLVNFTKAKSLDMDSTVNFNPLIEDPFDIYRGYGRDASDRADSLVVSWLYAIPGHFSNVLASSVLSGWTLTAIESFETGEPLTFLAGQDVAVDGTGGAQHAQFVTGDNPASTKMSHASRPAEVSEFFNTKVFVNPNNEPLGTYGNSGKGIVNGPAYADTDASVMKNFALIEGIKLQFRAESFNTFNQVNFANPNQTADSSAFGKITSTVAGTGRQLQFALKLNW